MSDYISRQAAIEKAQDMATAIPLPKLVVEEVFKQIPAADVVEVVRCEDCVHCETRNNEEPYCHQHAMTVSGDYFCADGVKGEWTP